ncbi:hypothetical protein LOY70_12185 [Pseudomonas sp. B21-054]|uniref:hypothetical protein n=1 Tax=Pseudomonas sp. B21-054 TaxID=2895494 RepID=UPI00222ED0FF|nr:hypothetical protein [Pseudomonas sp. B21-054]UZE20312.1 hypothetical protein LOY70_12185 [Pseudomonas sp. B21-054]
MSSVATNLDYASLKSEVDFTANLEDNSNFSAALTTLTTSTTPLRGEVWVVIAVEWNNGKPRTFTITYSKDIKEAVGAEITDIDRYVNLIYNNYEDPENPTLQKARSGSITYKMGPSQSFTGSFEAHIDKADGNGSYLCRGRFDTVLSL